MTAARRRSPARRRPADPARLRILDAAEAEVSAVGFAAASTNAIAAAAGVAKGLAFHHFGSKDGLLLAVYDRVLDRTVAALDAPDEAVPADLFERLHALTIRKIRGFQDDPQGYRVLIAAGDAPEPLRARIAARADRVRAEHLPRLLADIDPAPLRPGVTVADALETVSLLGDGLERRFIPELAALPDRGASQLDAVSRRAWAHYARLRDGLYRRRPRSTRGAARPG
jgi:AcrR family transcriptional regulator